MNKKFLTFLIIFFLLIVSTINPMMAGSSNNKSNVNNLKTKNNISDIFFDKIISFLMRFGHFPSFSACIVKNNKTVWSNAYGLYDIENNKQATINTIYLVGSTSKTVTATAIMQLYEKGYFDLDEDVNNFLPFSLRNPNHPDDQITFRMLLAHQSSLTSDNFLRISESYIPGDPDIPSYPYPWLEEYLTPNGSAYTPAVWTKSRPGEEFNYANIGFSILGYLVEIFSGQNFNEYCKEHIFLPLEMHNTSFRLTDLDVNNIAVPYDYNKNGYLSHPHYNMLVIYPAGSLRTTIVDLSNYLIAHMNGGIWNGTRILNESTIDLMHTIQYSDNEPYFTYGKYGLGFFVKENEDSEKEFGHGGSWFGVRAYMWVHESENTGILFFTNIDYSNTLRYYALQFLEKLLFFKAKRLN